MKHFLLRSVLSVGMLIFLSGCGGKVIDWTMSHFDQGDPVKECAVCVKPYIQTVRIYDQFTLTGAFTAMWLANTVRTEYAKLYAFMHGKNHAEEKAFLRRQLAENEHFIVFYVLSADEMKLGEPDSPWSLFLKVRGEMYLPIEVKMIDLDQEYEQLFNGEFNKFQTAYRVKFNAKNDDGTNIVAVHSPLVLEFRSLCKKFEMCFPVASCDPCEMPWTNQDFNPLL